MVQSNEEETTEVCNEKRNKVELLEVGCLEVISVSISDSSKLDLHSLELSKLELNSLERQIHPDDRSQNMGLESKLELELKMVKPALENVQPGGQYGLVPTEPGQSHTLKFLPLAPVLDLGFRDSAVEQDKENIAPAPPASKVKPSSCVFVASLSSSRTDDELCRSVTSHFSKFGHLVSVKVLRDLASRPYAFVQYTNDSDCRNAIEQGHNSTLDGRRLRCEAAKVNRTLFVSSTYAMTLPEVEYQMSQYGDIELIIASTDKGQLIIEPALTGTAIQNWFVKFCYREEAIRAFASITDDPSLSVEWAQNIDDNAVNAPKIDKNAIYIGLLSSDVTEKDIRGHFGAYGEIEEVAIKAKPTSTFAFVTYKSEEAAASAVANDNHLMFMNRTIHVHYKEVAPRPVTRLILSPKTPIALAPPPINVRRHRGFYDNTHRPTYRGEHMPVDDGSILKSDAYRLPQFRYRSQRGGLGSRDYSSHGNALGQRDYNSGASFGVSRRGYYGKRPSDGGSSGPTSPFFVPGYSLRR